MIFRSDRLGQFVVSYDENTIFIPNIDKNRMFSVNLDYPFKVFLIVQPPYNHFNNVRLSVHPIVKYIEIAIYL